MGKERIDAEGGKTEECGSNQNQFEDIEDFIYRLRKAVEELGHLAFSLENRMPKTIMAELGALSMLMRHPNLRVDAAARRIARGYGGVPAAIGPYPGVWLAESHKTLYFVNDLAVYEYNNRR